MLLCTFLQRNTSPPYSPHDPAPPFYQIPLQTSSNQSGCSWNQLLAVPHIQLQPVGTQFKLASIVPRPSSNESVPTKQCPHLVGTRQNQFAQVLVVARHSQNQQNHSQPWQNTIHDNAKTSSNQSKPSLNKPQQLPRPISNQLESSLISPQHGLCNTLPPKSTFAQLPMSNWPAYAQNLY